jgi:Fe2+ or Zn2+ uptake regulation protein
MLSIRKNFEMLEKWMAQSIKFKVTHHVMEFFGLCNSCQ